jgi:hypothetical protein
MFHEDNPTEESARKVETLVAGFEQEEMIEKNDPKTLMEAIARVLEDVDDLFYEMEVSALRSHFFSSIAKATPVLDRRTPEEHRSRWMTRWVLGGPEGRKRATDQWTKLVGFTGEYLVSLLQRYTNL